MLITMDCSTDANLEEADLAGVMSRRTALTTLGLAGAAVVLAACGGSSKSDSSATPSTGGTTSSSVTTAAPASCAVLSQEQEQGPYYYPAAAFRSDITDGKAGLPLLLRLSVMDIAACKPVANAAVDIWQADALGNYSDTSSGLYLRGLQMTDATGLATFTSLYPGWYPRRTNHVHVKVHVGGTAGPSYSGGHVSHTGNLFFPEEISTTVATLSPYKDNTSTRITLTNDFVYTGQQGSGSIMKLVPIDASTTERGYVASITLGIDPNATPSSLGISGTVS